VVPATAWSATGNKNGKTYRVRAPGEPLFEIARRTLGNGNRWSEIYALNPQLRPELPIPEGTILRMPPDAQVGP
jgi:nucleoid-associated protein YgaU